MVLKFVKKLSKKFKIIWAVSVGVLALLSITLFIMGIHSLIREALSNWTLVIIGGLGIIILVSFHLIPLQKLKRVFTA